jgi:hypothetical protein
LGNRETALLEDAIGVFLPFNDNVGHACHLGGTLAGAFLLRPLVARETLLFGARGPEKAITIRVETGADGSKRVTRAARSTAPVAAIPVVVTTWRRRHDINWQPRGVKKAMEQLVLIRMVRFLHHKRRDHLTQVVVSALKQHHGYT